MKSEARERPHPTGPKISSLLILASSADLTGSEDGRLVESGGSESGSRGKERLEMTGKGGRKRKSELRSPNDPIPHFLLTTPTLPARSRHR